jgi:hypothetical protein
VQVGGDFLHQGRQLAALEFIMRAINIVKTNENLYLSRENREMMKARDEAGRDKYKFL